MQYSKLKIDGMLRLFGAATFLALLLFVLGEMQPLAIGAIQLQVPAVRIDVGGGPIQLEKAIRKKLEEIGDDPYTLSELGSVLYNQGLRTEAKKLWNRAAAKEPNLPVANVEVVYHLFGRGDIKAAETALRHAKISRSEDPHVHMAAGELAMLRGDSKAASKAFSKAYGLGPRLVATNLALGRFHELTNNRYEALKMYRKATKLAPERPEAWLLLAADDFEQGEIQQAYQWLLEAEKVDKFQPLAEARLAEFYLGSGDYAGAYRWYRNALAKRPQDDPVQVRMGQMQLVLKRREEARKQFEEVLKRSEYVPALVAMGQLEETDGNLEVSAQLYRRVLKQDPNNIIANNNLAMLLVQSEAVRMDTGKTEDNQTIGEPTQDGSQGDVRSEALGLALNASRLQPDSPTIMSTYGCALFMAGDPKAAVEVLSKAVRLEPNDPWTRYFYGKALLATGQIDQASEQLENCLILDRNFSQKEEIRTLLLQ